MSHFNLTLPHQPPQIPHPQQQHQSQHQQQQQHHHHQQHQQQHQQQRHLHQNTTLPHAHQNAHQMPHQYPHQNHYQPVAQQQQQQQQHQFQPYNMNSSDYSSSTYHIYDQISDLIIIKQQRMERKLQKEQKRKVILFIAFMSILVVSTATLMYQLFFNYPTLANTSNNNNNQVIVNNSTARQYQQQQQPGLTQEWSGSQKVSASDWYIAPNGPIRLPLDNNIQFKPTTTTTKVIQSPSSALDCGAHGSVISTTATTTLSAAAAAAASFAGADSFAAAMNNNNNMNNQPQVVMCKCDAGFYGERCEYSMFGASGATYQAGNALLARCLMSNCSGQGQCNQQGRCQCFSGFFGHQCEFRLKVPAVILQQQQQPPLPSPQAPTNVVEFPKPNQVQPTSSSNRITSSIELLTPPSLCATNLNFCNGNGECLGSKCKCYPGFTGDACQVRQSSSEDHQTATAAAAATPPTTTASAAATATSTINCDNDPTNELCQQQPQAQQCSAQCLRNGQCVDGVCLCQAGFYGKHCLLNGCPNNCSGRGQCVRTSDDQLLMMSSAAVVQSSSQQHSFVAEWRCQCQSGSVGDDCSTLVERQCDDGIDNDKDGLVDCADSECCSDKVCQNTTLCVKSPDPLDILMRKQPPPPTSSFFERMKFLIEKSSSQTYTHSKEFNDSIMMSRYVNRASVIRGRVTYLKQGVTGVRVFVAGQTNLGTTFTRDGGYFDLMVNGGGAVVIEFWREPFVIKQKAVRVPWNEIVLIEPVELSLDPTQAVAGSKSTSQAQDNNNNSEEQQQDTEIEQQSTSSACSAHNYRLMRPQIVAAPKSWRRSHSSNRINKSPTALSSSHHHHHQQQQQQQHSQASSRAVILRDSGMVQQSILLPASSNDQNQSVSLVYISSRANEFMSTISIQLTPSGGHEMKQLPQELKLIHLKIIIEGNLFEQVFEAQLNLSFTYAWNRRNVYRQKSFGLSTALVSVGYEYFDCKHIVWSTKQIQLAAHDLSISDIGSQWNLNIHHRYNYRDSILQRGDGQNFNLKSDKAKVVEPILGDGYQRSAQCSLCDGATSALEQRMLKPQALVSAPDGSIYLGDFNLIRRIEWASNSPVAPSGGGASLRQNQLNSAPSALDSATKVITKTVLELPATRVPSKYSLALNLADQNKLYMSDIDRHQVYLIREQDKQQQYHRQQPQDSQAANETQVNFGAGGEDNLIPVAGNGIKCELESDLSNCGDGQLAQLARLIEPKAIAFDLEQRMYIADGPNVRMVEAQGENAGKIFTILGAYKHQHHHHHHQQQHSNSLLFKFPCSGEAIPMHKWQPRAPVDLALSPIDDTLHVLDENVVYKITKDKRVQIVAGRLEHCAPSGGEQANNKNNKRQLRATEVYLQSAQSIAFSANGDLFISEDDQRQMISRVLLVSPLEDTIQIYAGLPVDSSLQQQQQSQQQQLEPTVDSLNVVVVGNSNNLNELSQQEQQQQQLELDKQRLSNTLPINLALNSASKALEYKFNSISALAVDQQGNLLIADKIQLRLLSVQADLPQMNSVGEYELVSPDNTDELLVFNRHGHHVATRNINTNTANNNNNSFGSASSSLVRENHSNSRSTSNNNNNNNKYTFTYNMNTSLGQLSSVSFGTTTAATASSSPNNKISIYRDAPVYSVKMIETAHGGQCKLDISRNGQVHSISTIAPNATKTNFSYHVEGGLLKQSRDQASGEVFEFNYDEFGRAISVQHSAPNLLAPIECRLSPIAFKSTNSFMSQQCSALIVSE